MVAMQSLRKCSFLKLFPVFDQRLSAYAKIRNSEVEIIDQVEAKCELLTNIINAAGDFTQTWRKDIVQLLRYAAATVIQRP